MKKVIFLSLIGLAFGGRRLTPLLDDSHPCIAENLKDSHRYICDGDANVICLTGWKEHDDPKLRDLTNPCPVPICEYNGDTCAHGECIRPDICACEVGWEGFLCDKCVCLPGCMHGTCDFAFECNCKENDQGIPLFKGTFCNMPNCPNCNPHNGQCLEPFLCACNDGWEGQDCDICVPLNGCVNGDCDSNKPGTCLCREGWTGHLCDEPICSEGCHQKNGYCEMPNECICRTGWENGNCTQCLPYWECPSTGTCNEPNQCICDAFTVSIDTEGYCNREDINGPIYGPFSDCSNPCKQNDIVNLDPGTRSRSIRWCPLSGCNDTTELCYGSRSWTFINGDGSGTDVNNCIYDSGAPTTTEEPTTTAEVVTTTTPEETSTTSVSTTTKAPTSVGFFTTDI